MYSTNNLNKPAVSSAVAYDRRIISNGFVPSCTDNEALPKGEVGTARERQPSLVSNGVGTRLNGMDNISELLINIVTCIEPNDTGLYPKGKQSVNLLLAGVTRTSVLPVDRQILTHSLLLTWNMVSPYLSRKSGKRTARQAYGGAGIGLWKKQMPFCNETDRNLNVIPLRKQADFRIR
jgi:hypothetical protein